MSDVCTSMYCTCRVGGGVMGQVTYYSIFFWQSVTGGGRKTATLLCLSLIPFPIGRGVLGGGVGGLGVGWAVTQFQGDKKFHLQLSGVRSNDRREHCWPLLILFYEPNYFC